MNKEFIKITALYAAGVIVFFYMIWSLLSVALPEAQLDLVRALSTSFGINLPDDMVVSAKMGMRAISVVAIITVLSIGLIVLNVFFSAIITARLIKPRVKIITSDRGVLSTKWNAAMPYVLVRLSNFHKFDLADVKISVVLTVEEIRSNGVKGEQFMSYLPINDFTPPRILLMAPRMPWSIAVPGDSFLSNSLVKDYHFKPGEPISKSFSAGKKLEYARRTLQILIQGMDTDSYTQFAIHRKILVDEQDGDKYTLHLHRGTFKSLPLHIDDADDLNRFGE